MLKVTTSVDALKAPFKNNGSHSSHHRRLKALQGPMGKKLFDVFLHQKHTYL
jgi:hypothetical protein